MVDWRALLRWVLRYGCVISCHFPLFCRQVAEREHCGYQLECCCCRGHAICTRQRLGRGKFASCRVISLLHLVSVLLLTWVLRRAVLCALFRFAYCVRQCPSFVVFSFYPFLLLLTSPLLSSPQGPTTSKLPHPGCSTRLNKLSQCRPPPPPPLPLPLMITVHLQLGRWGEELKKAGNAGTSYLSFPLPPFSSFASPFPFILLVPCSSLACIVRR
ncbi:hypothetical protein BDQ17DRAFT_1022683 [Cyathus striatus]|nr:hypothetical protein BDQ17DRAFT_1022683 [Cyathus striatus]